MGTSGDVMSFCIGLEGREFFPVEICPREPRPLRL
jgi:hypothetical protein